jgi:hypothetical protein
MNACIKSLLISAVVVSSSAFAETGGRLVKSSDPIAASTVGLRFLDGENEGGCSGTIIADNLILTAAHCLKGSVPEISFGADMNNPVQTVSGDFMFIPSDYNDATEAQNRHDIGLIKFSGGLPSGFHPVSLVAPSRSAAVAEGVPSKSALHVFTPIIVAGYGIDRLGAPPSHFGELKRARLHVSIFRASRTERQALQTSFGGICPGDSGGPAFIEKKGTLYLWGVNNLISGAKSPISRCGFMGTYADVSSPELATWLETTIEHVGDIQCGVGTYDCENAIPVQVNAPSASAPRESSGR